jgi:hypothetical protein
VKHTAWYATKPMGMAGTSARSRSLASSVSACGLTFDTGVDVRTQHGINPNIGRPTGLGGPSPG